MTFNLIYLAFNINEIIQLAFIFFIIYYILHLIIYFNICSSVFIIDLQECHITSIA